ncbi:MAG: protein kinase, partial [Planctomycetota bacterium JB042]
MSDRPSEEQLWSWIDRRAPELDRYLASHPEDRERIDEMRRLVGAVAAHAREAPPARPERIGPYRITGLLGQGGMGIVYAAERDDAPRPVALKVGRRAFGEDDEHAIKLFRREILALARLDHPAVARLLEAGRTEAGDHWFAMERVDGLPIDRWADERAPSRRDRVEAVRRVAEAVEDAHRKGILHRDLKPSNVLVEADGSPRVLDFGLARLNASDVSFSLTRTETGAMLGTLQSMSPEQARGDRERVDERTDVYALGVLLYRVLLGVWPYAVDASSPVRAIAAICDVPPRRPTKVDETLEPALETIVLTALEKRPGRRYPTAAAFADDLGRFLSGAPIAARPVGAIVRAGRFLGRHPSLAVAVGAALIVAGVVLKATLDPPVRVVREGVDATSSFEPRRYPKLSPFEALRWEDAAPIVTVSGVEYELLAIEGEPVELIVGLCKKVERNVSWRKRFTEDLYEVMLRLKRASVGEMATVTLDVVRIDDPARTVRRIDAPMTEENRRRLRRDRYGVAAFDGIRWIGDRAE